MVRGDAEVLRRSLFEQRAAEALIVEAGGEAVGYAIYFSTFSTFECRSGVWIEDVYVRPQHRRGGFYDKLGAIRLDEWKMLRLERDGMQRLVD